MSEVGELAAVLGPGSVLLVQASTPTEARLIRERVAAASRARARRWPASGRRPPRCPAKSWTAARTPFSCRSGWPGCPRSTRPAGGPAGRHDARPRPVPAQRTAAAADPGPPAGPGPGPGRRARHDRLAAPRWAEATGGEDPDDFGAYVARRATLALDRAEYRLRGPRYKTPSLVKEEILASRRFRAGLNGVRRGPGRTPRRWKKRARSSTSSPRAGAAGSSTCCRPSGG